MGRSHPESTDWRSARALADDAAVLIACTAPFPAQGGARRLDRHGNSRPGRGADLIACALRVRPSYPDVAVRRIGRSATVLQDAEQELDRDQEGESEPADDEATDGVGRR
jgi:hypothetical protein